MSKQLIYTSCRSGLSGSEGDQVYSHTEGLSAQNIEEMVKRSGYLKPINMMDSDETEQFPIQFEYYDITGGRCFDLGTYQYTDYTKVRYGSRLVHHIRADDLKGYPIEYYLNGCFRTSMSDEETDSDEMPGYLPEVSMDLNDDRVIDLGSISAFMDRCDSEFLLKLVYSLISHSKDGSTLVAGFDSFNDIPYYLAVMTMILPREMADRITFTTYVMNPDSYHDRIVCSLTEGTRLNVYGDNVVTDDTPMPAINDPIFNSYIMTAFSEDSDRSDFFDFLSAFSVHDFSEDIITAYNTFYISSFGPAMVSDEMLIKCVDFIKLHECTNEDYIYSFYSKVEGSDRYDNDFNTIFARITKSLKVDQIRDDIQDSIVDFDSREMSALDPEGLYAAMEESESDVQFAIYSERIDLVPKPHVYAVLISLWTKNRNPSLEDILRKKQAEMTDDDVKFVSDVVIRFDRNELSRLIAPDTPIDGRVLKNIVLSMTDGDLAQSRFLEFADLVKDDPDILMEVLDRYSASSSFNDTVMKIISKYGENCNGLSSAVLEYAVGINIKNKEYNAASELLNSVSSADKDLCHSLIDAVNDDLVLSNRPSETTVSAVTAIVDNIVCREILDSEPDSKISILRFGIEMLSKISEIRPNMDILESDERRRFYLWVIKDSAVSDSAAFYETLISVDGSDIIHEAMAESIPEFLSRKNGEKYLSPLLIAGIGADGSEEKNIRYTDKIKESKSKVIDSVRKQMVNEKASDDILKFYDSQLTSSEKKGFLGLFRSKKS